MQAITIRVHPETINVRFDPAIRAEIAAAREEANQYRLYASTLSSADGDPYALVGDPGSKPGYVGVGRLDSNSAEEIEKARKIAHGHFLWFRHEGKSYIVDDPAVVSQIEAMNKPEDDLRDRMHALRDQKRANGEQQRELGKQMRDVSVPTPDLSKQLAELNAAVDSLKAKQGGTISQKDLGDLQREIGRIQGELGSLQGKIVMQQINADGGMAKFGEQQGKLGGQMGKLGAELGQKAQENQSEVKKIIDESMKDGKAKPVE
jgi:chromosome segregation ATPase